MTERYLNITEFAKRVGVTTQTVRLWDRKNKIHPHHRSPGGIRWYSEQQVQDCLSSKNYVPGAKRDGATETGDTVTLTEDGVAELVRSGAEAVNSGATPEQFAAAVIAANNALRDA